MTEPNGRTVTEPDACRHCGLPQRGHMQRWATGVGWHVWAAPTDRQRLARMKARRRLRGRA